MRPLERAGCVLLSAGPRRLETENHDFWGLSGSNDAALSVLGADELFVGTGKPTPSSSDPKEGEIRPPPVTDDNAIIWSSLMAGSTTEVDTVSFCRFRRSDNDDYFSAEPFDHLAINIREARA